MGRYGGTPTAPGCGPLGRGMPDRAADIIAARARSESLLQHSDVSVYSHAHESRPATGTEQGTDYLADLNRCKDRHG